MQSPQHRTPLKPSRTQKATSASKMQWLSSSAVLCFETIAGPALAEIVVKPCCSLPACCWSASVLLCGAAGGITPSPDGTAALCLFRS